MAFWFCCPYPSFICGPSVYSYSSLIFFSLVPFTRLQWVFTNALRAAVLGVLPLHRQGLCLLIGDKLGGSDWCVFPLPQNCSIILLGLQHDAPSSGLFQIFPVGTCWGCEERTWKKYRLPQVLWPPRILHLPVRLYSVFTNVSTILVELFFVAYMAASIPSKYFAFPFSLQTLSFLGLEPFFSLSLSEILAFQLVGKNCEFEVNLVTFS